MALGFTCFLCGWEESVHILGDRAPLSLQEKSELKALKSGRIFSFFDCTGYAPGSDERKAVADQEELVRRFGGDRS